MFLFRKRKNDGSQVRREGDLLIYNAIDSGSSSSGSNAGDEENGAQGGGESNGAFPTRRTNVSMIPPKVETPTRPVPDPWSLLQEETDAINGAQAHSQIDANSTNTNTNPTPQQAVLMEAWMSKRREQRMEHQQQRFQSMMDPRTGGFQQVTPVRKNKRPNSRSSTDDTADASQQTNPQHSQEQQQQQQPPQQQEAEDLAESQQPPWFLQRPIDVDTGVEIIQKYDDSEFSYTHDIPTVTASFVGEDARTVSSKAGSIASYPSNSTSDMTPVVSNKTFRHHHRPSLQPNLPPIQSHDSSGIPGGDDSHESPPSTDHESCGKQCRAFLDVRTYHGKLALLLLIILVLAVTTMVVSALLAGQSRRIINESNNNNDDVPIVMTRLPTPARTSFAPSLRPSHPPTVAPTRISLVTQAPNGAGDDPSSPTWLPTAPDAATQAPSLTRTSWKPSLAPSTVAPTTYKPTSDPTLAPSTAWPTTRPTTVSPTLPPTANPTAVPSATPTTLAPTMEPLDELVLVAGDIVEGPSMDAAFGSSLALSGDGRVMVVGSPGYQRRLGRVEVFVLQEFPNDPVRWQWVPRDVKLGSVAQGTLGQAVAINRDGTIFAVSEPGVERRAGRAVVYAYNPGSNSYVQLGNEIAGSAAASYSGTAIAMSADGMRIAVGAPYYSGVNGLQLHGQVVVYELTGSEWARMGNPISGEGTLDWLGSAVDLSEDGSRLVASAPRNSNLDGYVGTWEWNPVQRDWVRWGSGDIFNDYVPALSSDRFGHSLALSTTAQGTQRLAIGIPWKSINGQRNAGMAVVYELDPLGNRWVQLGGPIIQNPPLANTETGSAIDLLDGRFLLVGIPGAASRAGEVQLYRFDEVRNDWEAHPVPLTGTTPGDDFGVALAAQREVEINQEGISLVVGAISQNRGGIGYVQSFLEE